MWGEEHVELYHKGTTEPLENSGGSVAQMMYLLMIGSYSFLLILRLVGRKEKGRS